MKRRLLPLTVLGGVLLLLSLSSCLNRTAILPPPLITDNSDDNEEALKGQWQVVGYPHIIDIQHTKPGYWIFASYVNDASPAFTMDEGVVKSNRATDEDGWFVVSFTEMGTTTTIRYRFKDGDQDTLEAVLESDDSEDKPELELTRLDSPVDIIILPEWN